MPLKPEYLGDAVYATHTDNNTIMLTTETHEEVSANNTIFLEPEVVYRFIDYAMRAGIYKPNKS